MLTPGLESSYCCFYYSGRKSKDLYNIHLLLLICFSWSLISSLATWALCPSQTGFVAISQTYNIQTDTHRHWHQQTHTCTFTPMQQLLTYTLFSELLRCCSLFFECLSPKIHLILSSFSSFPPNCTFSIRSSQGSPAQDCGDLVSVIHRLSWHCLSQTADRRMFASW